MGKRIDAITTYTKYTRSNFEKAWAKIYAMPSVKGFSFRDDIYNIYHQVRLKNGTVFSTDIIEDSELYIRKTVAPRNMGKIELVINGKVTTYSGYITKKFIKEIKHIGENARARSPHPCTVTMSVYWDDATHVGEYVLKGKRNWLEY